LTNNLRINETVPRLFLLAGMAGFLVMALALPHAFDRDGLAFGVAYLLVVMVHAGLFSLATNTPSARAIWQIAPYNLAAAALVLIAGFVEAPWDWAIWTGAVAVLVSSTLLRRESGFTLNPSHFAERHGLVVLIVLGESLVAIGAGAEGIPVGLPLIGAAVLALALSALLWWSYFDRDDRRAEHALAAAEPGRRAQLGLHGYGYAHLFIIFGIVIMAAGVKQVIAHLDEPYYVSAIWNLAGGIGLYLLADALFRRIFGIGRTRARWIAGALALLSVPVGLIIGGLAELGLLIAILVGMLAYEKRR
jgi:low temperature requirement protein LtrA